MAFLAPFNDDDALSELLGGGGSAFPSWADDASFDACADGDAAQPDALGFRCLEADHGAACTRCVAARWHFGGTLSKPWARQRGPRTHSRS